MDAGEFLAKVASLIADPSRATMLWSLIGGESRPASELALLANVSPQTASNHLKILVDAEFVTVDPRGRNRFYSLKGAPVAAALEALAVVSTARKPSGGIAQRTSPELLFARTCYDHLAGELSVAIFIRLRENNYLQEHDSGFRLTSSGKAYFQKLGIDLSQAEAKRRRRFAYGCMDWSQRTPHLGGSLGSALLNWLSHEHIVVRRKGTRSVRLGETAPIRLRQAFGIQLTQNRLGLSVAGEPRLTKSFAS
jgi:DNA-binding transcriptional ArsR family regulator